MRDLTHSSRPSCSSSPGPSEYMVAEGTALEDRKCASHSKCVPNLQYETKAASTGVDRECEGLTKCLAGSFVSVKATATTDRACTCPCPKYVPSWPGLWRALRCVCVFFLSAHIEPSFKLYLWGPLQAKRAPTTRSRVKRTSSAAPLSNHAQPVNTWRSSTRPSVMASANPARPGPTKTRSTTGS